MPRDLIAPSIHDVEWFYWEAFGELNTERQAGCPIPWSAIMHYADMQSGTDRASFHRIIRIMDGAYLNFINEEKG